MSIPAPSDDPDAWELGDEVSGGDVTTLRFGGVQLSAEEVTEILREADEDWVSEPCDDGT